MSHTLPTVSLDTTDVDGGWRRSSLCANAGCVEVSSGTGAIRVRDSKRSDSPILTFDTDEWRVFVAGVKNGEFDS